MYIREKQTMILTYNIQLKFDKQEDFAFWQNTLEMATQAYNACANFLYANNIPLNIKDVHNAVYSWMRDTFPSLPAQGIIKIYKEVLGAVRSIKSNKHKDAEIPQKHNLSMRLDKRLYANLDSEGISLTSSIKRKRTRLHFVLFDKVKDLFNLYKTNDPLLFMRDGKIYLSVPFEVSEKPLKDNTCIGVDLGIKRFITTSEGKVFIDKEFNARKRKLRYLKRCLQSKGTESAKRHLNKLSKKEKNMSKCQTYKAVNALLSDTSASIIVMEDLSKIKQNTSKNEEGIKRAKHNNMLSQVPFYTFKRILTYKATLVGKQVVSVSPTWTSQMDCRTNKRDGKRQGCRYYCSDGIVFDADWNAAINIVQRYNKHPQSSDTLPIDGKIIPLCGRVSVNAPIVE